MDTNRESHEDPTFVGLVSTLLKLDCSALASLGGANGAASNMAAAGLHELMRQTLERTVSLLWARDDFTLHLHSDASAKALRCNAKIHNLVELFAWALVRVPRRIRGSGELALCEADATVVHLPQKQNKSKTRSSVDQLARIAKALLAPDFMTIRDTPGPSESSISIRALMAEMLGVQPELLIQLHYETQEAAEHAFARDPEGQSVAGLSALLTLILCHYPQILDRETEGCVLGFQIVSAADAGFDRAAAANLGALLTAGLFADGARQLSFVA